MLTSFHLEHLRRSLATLDKAMQSVPVNAPASAQTKTRTAAPQPVPADTVQEAQSASELRTDWLTMPSEAFFNRIPWQTGRR
jgi:hypothetical protein